MYNDPTNPYNQYPAYTGDPADNEVESDRFGDPDGDGYWRLIDGVWRWFTEPLARSATTTS